MEQKKTGLVLEGGAMRGLFSAGVMDVMMEHGISYDGAIGVSAGAVFGCNYKSNQPGRSLRYNLAYCRDPRYCSLRSWLKTGDLYGADFCYRELPDELDIFDWDSFDSSPMEFYAVCTNVETGGPVYKKCEKADRSSMDWIRASASMPLASRIVELDGYQLLDGGVADSIPLRYFQEIGYEKNVVVLTQPRNYRKRKNKQLPLLRVALRKYPEMIRAMENRHNRYNETLDYIREQEQLGKVFVISPAAPLEVGAVERHPERLQSVYQLGRAAANRQLEDLRAFLEKPL